MEPNEQIAPVPTSPEGVPGIENQSTDLSEESMRTNLDNVMGQLKDQYATFDNENFSAGVQRNEMRSHALSELFTILESKGVNPENPEEVKAYLDKIRASNPEIAAQIERAINDLLGEEEIGGEVNPEVQPSEDMNINQNEELQENI